MPRLRSSLFRLFTLALIFLAIRSTVRIIRHRPLGMTDLETGLLQKSSAFLKILTADGHRDSRRHFAVVIHDNLRRLQKLNKNIVRIVKARRLNHTLDASLLCPTSHLHKEELSLDKDFLDDLPCIRHLTKRNLPELIHFYSGAQESCHVNLQSFRSFPHCFEKLKWMRESWNKYSCYADAGVDGSECSFLKYLSEVEDFCPPIETRRPMPYENIKTISKLNLSLAGATALFNRQSGLTASVKFMRDRMARLWPAWTEGVLQYPALLAQRGLSPNISLTGGPKLKILVYMGFLKVPGFDTGLSKGGPQGEYVQWTDLISALFILGHELTVIMGPSDLNSVYGLTNAKKQECVTTDRTFDRVFTDITGYRQITGKLSSFSRKQPACSFRILDSFGTQAKFNAPAYEPSPGSSSYFSKMPSSSWSGLSLSLKQFYTLFPHTPDNSFLGFVVEQGSKTVGNLKPVNGKPIALIYAKKNYMLEPVEVKKFIRVLTEYFEVHATIADATSDLPKTIRNHGLLAGTAYMEILRSSKIFVGVGFPYEGPAPLEAIANGVIFVNPSFNPPKSRNNTDFFSAKPTSRALTSQHPYIEHFIGEPYSYTVDNRNETAVRELFLRLQRHPRTPEYVPFELTTAGLLERLHAYLTHQNFCPELPPLPHSPSNPMAEPRVDGNSSSELQQVNRAYIRPVVRWPPMDSSLTVLLGKPGVSCSATCQAHRNPANASSRFVCCPEHFSTFNDHSSLRRLNLSCGRIFMRSHLAMPAFSTLGQTCYFQANDFLFDCNAPGEISANLTIRRICPCRDALPGQWALCRDCL